MRKFAWLLLFTGIVGLSLSLHAQQAGADLILFNGKIITVNDNLRPLSLAKPSTLSYDLGLALNYFNNALKFTYLYRGSDYTSFGQTFLRKDIQGFNVLDRLRLVENQLYLSLGYERLQDNTSQTKVATTTFSTVNIAVSYFPRVDLPRLTVGFTRWTNGNGISAAGYTVRLVPITSRTSALAVTLTALVISLSFKGSSYRTTSGFIIPPQWPHLGIP
jgi:hypothetical protein